MEYAIGGDPYGYYAALVIGVERNRLLVLDFSTGGGDREHTQRARFHRGVSSAFDITG